MKIEEQRFWVVWCPGRGNPTVKHWSREAADREAERLSASNQGQPYYVLKAVGGIVAKRVNRDRIKMTDDGLPF